MKAHRAAPIPNAYWVADARLLAGEYPGVYPGDTSTERAREKLGRLLDAGVSVFLDLTERGQLVPYEPLLRAEATRRGVNVAHLRRPIRDVDVPTPEAMSQILATIRAGLEAGRIVYVHCWGGVGRTGTVVGCYLVDEGYSGEAALEQVQRFFGQMSAAKLGDHLGGSPETDEQREFVRTWATKRPEFFAERAPPTIFDQERLPYVHGCLLGGAVGDALGAPVEFATIAEIRAAYGDDGVQDFPANGGGPAQVTDDTQMTLFTAEGVLRATSRANDRGHANYLGCLHRAYLRWLKTQDEPGPEPPWFEEWPGWLIGVRALHARRAPGLTCLSALKSDEAGTFEEPLNNSKGCGGVMRAAPIGLFLGVEDPFTWGKAAAVITHGHPTGYLAAGALSHLISLVMQRVPLRKAIMRTLTRLRRERSHEETTAAIRAALSLSELGDPSPERVAQLGEGWVAEEALAIAVYRALSAGNDFAAGVRLAVNHSGDSDSTGAITGNILGALLGINGIPLSWRDKVELAGEIEILAADICEEYEESAEWRRKYPPS